MPAADDGPIGSPARRPNDSLGSLGSPDVLPARPDGSRRHPIIPFRLVRRSSMIVADTGEHIRSTDQHGTWKVSNRGRISETTPLLEHPGEQVAQLGQLAGFSQPAPKLSGSLNRSAQPTLDHRRLLYDVLKCTVAYTLASLCVFTSLGNVFGFSGSKHQVATVSVYFNPARTVGGMIQAVWFVSLMLVYALTVALCSMGLAHVFYDIKWFEFGYLTMLILFVGGSLGSIGYFKIKMSNPTFDTACSVAIIFLVISLIKEDDIQYGILSLDQLAKYFLMVLSGTCLSAVVCFSFKPVAATSVLKADLRKVAKNCTSELGIVLNSFVRGQSVASPEFDARHGERMKLVGRAKAALSHAQLELVLTGRFQEYEILHKILESYSRIVMHISGLVHCTLVLDQLLDHDNESPLVRLNGNTSQSDSMDTHARQISAAVLLKSFIYHLGPPMNSFTTTLTDVASELPFNEKGESVLNYTHIKSLQSALALYSGARERALYNVYGHKSLHDAPYKEGDKPKRASGVEPTFVDEEGVVATCGNFSYLLEDLGEETLALLDLLRDYSQLEDKPSWHVISLLSLFRREKAERPFSSVTKSMRPTRAEEHTLGFRIWYLLRQMRRVEIQFAIKVGFGAIVIATPAFLPQSRPYFAAWRGEWAVIVYMIMMARNFGAMSINIPYRIIGTILGALLATFGWFISGGRRDILIPYGAIIAAGCFYMMLSTSTPFGRFTLLTYNLVCLYGYSVAQPLDDNKMTVIMDIAFHRTISVSVGVIWAVIVTVFVLPFNARQALRVGLSTQWMRMGIVWKANPLGTLPRKDPNNPEASIQGIYGEAELQDEMVVLHTFLRNAPHEFRLRGKFNPLPFEQMLRCTQVILDAYHSLSILISKSPTATSKELELIEVTSPEVRELTSSIFMFFYTASTALRVGLPVPEYLPVPANAVQKMLEKLKHHRNELDESQDGYDTEDFVLFYSYVLATMTVVENLSRINDVLRALYGSFYEHMFAYDG